MKLEQILREIDELCRFCEQCDPCCTGYLLKKYIESNRSVLHAA